MSEFRACHLGAAEQTLYRRWLTRLIIAAVLVLLTVAFSGRAEGQATTPHVEVSFEVSPARATGLLEEVAIEVTVSGLGGRIGDLPKSVRDRLPRKPLEVALVLDRSGSMERDDYRPTRIEAAKTAAKVFLEQIQTGDSTALVSFNERVTLDVPLTEDRDRTLDALSRLRPDGYTAIGDGLQLAFEVLQREDSTETVKAIVLLSDGSSNEGRDPVDVAEAVGNAGIPVFTVGIGAPGDDFDESVLKTIAERTGGEYLYAPNERELSRVYEGMGGKVINVAGVDVELQLNITDFFQVTDFTVESLESDSADSLSYRYDLIPVGEQKKILLRGSPNFYLPGESVPLIGSIILRYHSLASGQQASSVYGPAAIVFEGLDRTVRDRNDDPEIDQISFERTREDYPDVVAYSIDDSIEAEIWGRMAIVDTKPFKLRVILHRIFVERPQVTGIPAWPGGAACYSPHFPDQPRGCVVIR